MPQGATLKVTKPAQRKCSPPMCTIRCTYQVLGAGEDMRGTDDVLTYGSRVC
jgi:hypothetical protein